jgi:hypothetical protein
MRVNGAPFSNPLPSPQASSFFTHFFSQPALATAATQTATSAFSTDDIGNNSYTLDNKLFSGPSFSQGLLKLLADTALTAVAYLLTYSFGQSALINVMPKSKIINRALGEIIGHDKVSNLTGQIARGGTNSTFLEYKKSIEQHRPQLLKELQARGLTERDLKFHQYTMLDHRKLIAGASIALISYLRTVFFAPNSNIGRPDFLSGSALLSVGLPIVANTLYYLVYDRGLSLPGYKHAVTAKRMDTFLDISKAANKALKRYVPTGTVKDFFNGGVLLGSSLFAREARDRVESSVLTPLLTKGQKYLAPKNITEMLKYSGSRALLKAAIDTPAFVLTVSGLQAIIDYLAYMFTGERTPQIEGSTYFGSPTGQAAFQSGLTSQLLSGKQVAFSF